MPTTWQRCRRAVSAGLRSWATTTPRRRVELVGVVAEQRLQHVLGQEGDVAAALAEVLVVGALERGDDLVGGRGEGPLGVGELLADRRLGAQDQVRVAQHHLLGLQDLAVLAVRQAGLDLLELLPARCAAPRGSARSPPRPARARSCVRGTCTRRRSTT
jgi:hypothetical protein